MQVDYIIVGLGLAGMAFTKELEQRQKSFVVFEDNSQNSSNVAGGMYNPVVLKRFTPVWNGKRQLGVAIPFYEELEKKFLKKYHYPLDIYRIFKSVEEQNNWFATCDNPSLSPYMIPEIAHDNFNGVMAPYGYGKLRNTGRIDTKELLNDYRRYLREQELIKNERFNHSELRIESSEVKYQHVNATRIVFCEGFGLMDNPFFNYLPMQGAKGELLTIFAPELKIDFLIKAAVFIMPLGECYFKVGATFNWKDKTKIPTEEGKRELIEKLETVIDVPYTVVGHTAGVRPTVKDRRPLVGKHSVYENLSVLNGLGTRGVMIAPTLAKALYNHLEMNDELDKNIAISRFS